MNPPSMLHPPAAERRFAGLRLRKFAAIILTGWILSLLICNFHFDRAIDAHDVIQFADSGTHELDHAHTGHDGGMQHAGSCCSALVGLPLSIGATELAKPLFHMISIMLPSLTIALVFRQADSRIGYLDTGPPGTHKPLTLASFHWPNAPPR
jgi:hypothetical protein